MPLVNTEGMFRKAYNNSYSIGAFNICNMELVQGIALACKETGSSVIFQVSQGAGKYAGYDFLKKMVELAVNNSGIEAALHLDHGNSFDLCKYCINNGFTSVMIDGSALPFDENVRITSEVVKYAKLKNVSVEGELGKLQGTEDSIECSDEHSFFTDPIQAKEFVEKTGVNSLAIAIGTSHGINKFSPTSTPKLRFDILEQIQSILPGFPIVLHGASSVSESITHELSKYGISVNNARGIPEDMLRKASKTSVCKINIDSDLRLASTLAVKKFMSENPNNFDPRGYFGSVRNAVYNTVKDKILNVLGSSSIK